MLLKSFKQKVLSESKFQITVRDGENTFDSFVVDYCEVDSEKSNVLRLIELYDKKAIVENVHFNKAIGLISVWVKVK